MTELLNGRAASDRPGADFGSVRVGLDGPPQVIALSGELDLASRVSAISACSSTDLVDVIVDLGDLVFMDCAGYGALVESSMLLGGRGGSMSLRAAIGEPLRLLTLLGPGSGGGSGGGSGNEPGLSFRT